MVKLGNLLILGDSYSTFEGYVPDSYEVYYSKSAAGETGVNGVEQTWWMRLIRATQSRLLLNSSWSGTTVCNTGYCGDCTENSFITRFDRLAEGGFFRENQVDTVLIFGGTNDSWANAPIGELQYAGWRKEDLYFFLPAVCYLIHRVKTALPRARVICVINTEMKDAIAGGIKTACEKFGAEAIALNEIEKQSGHPNGTGMAQICEQILRYLEEKSCPACAFVQREK